MAAPREIQLRVLCRDTKPGDKVKVVGNIPRLGSWNPHNTQVEMECDGTFPWWVAASFVVEEPSVEYKYVIVRQDSRVEWESSPNRVIRLSGPAARGGILQVAEVWSMTDTAKCEDPAAKPHFFTQMRADLPMERGCLPQVLVKDLRVQAILHLSALKNGLLPGDEIRTLQGRSVRNDTELEQVWSALRPGQGKIEFGVWRGGIPAGSASGASKRALSIDAHTTATKTPGASSNGHHTPRRGAPSQPSQDLRPLPMPDSSKIQMADPRGQGPGCGVIAFYYAGKNETWDSLCGGAFLGNFWDLHPRGMTVEAQGRTAHFRNAEAAFQALKFWTRAHDFQDLSGDDAFRLKQRWAGHEDRTYAGYGNNWLGMRAVLRSKFAADTAAAERLIQTGDAFLLEHNPVPGRDNLWSNNHIGDGANWLGMQLMLQRDWLHPPGATKSWTRFIQDDCQVDFQNGTILDPHGLWRNAVMRATQEVHRVVATVAASSAPSAPSVPTCAAAGCRNPTWNSKPGEFCSRTCKSRGPKL